MTPTPTTSAEAGDAVKLNYNEIRRVLLKMGPPWKLGDEFAPFNPDASHVPPDYRDAWNRCYLAALSAQAERVRVLEEKLAKAQKNEERYAWLSDRFLGADFDYAMSDDGSGTQVLLVRFDAKEVWGSLDLTVDAALSSTTGSAALEGGGNG